MSTSLLPRWPGQWWVYQPNLPPPRVTIKMIDLRWRKGDEQARCRGVIWQSLWDVGPDRNGAVFLRLGWFRPFVGGRLVGAAELRRYGLDAIADWDQVELERQYRAWLDARGRLAWDPRLPASLGRVVDRAVELLGRGELRAGMRYTVAPP